MERPKLCVAQISEITQTHWLQLHRVTNEDCRIILHCQWNVLFTVKVNSFMVTVKG